MTDFNFNIEQGGVEVKIADEKQGLFGRFKKRAHIDITQLSGREKTFAISLSRIRAQDREGQHHQLKPNSLWLDHWMVSRLDDLSARVLGLPPKLKGIEFHAEMSGTIGSERFSLDWRWERAGRTIQLSRTGAIVDNSNGPMRLPGPIYDAIMLSASFDSGKSLPEHWRALSDFRTAIGLAANDGIASPDGYLQKVEIVSCDKVGLALDPEDPFDFAPLPFVAAQLTSGEQPSKRRLRFPDRNWWNSNAKRVLAERSQPTRLARTDL
jgi:hypothetical protein